jgi:hypothetical protein
MKKILLFTFLFLLVNFVYSQDNYKHYPYKTINEIIKIEKESGFVHVSTFQVTEIFKIMLFNNPIRREQRLLWYVNDEFNLQRNPNTNKFPDNLRYYVKDISKIVKNRKIVNVEQNLLKNSVKFVFDDKHIGKTTITWLEWGVQYEINYIENSGRYYSSRGYIK